MKLYDQIKIAIDNDENFNAYWQPRIYTKHFQQGNFAREMLETAIDAMVDMVNSQYEPYYYSAPVPFIGHIVVDEREHQVYHSGVDRVAYFIKYDEARAMSDLLKKNTLVAQEKTPENLVILFTFATMCVSRLGYKLEPMFNIIIKHKQQKITYFGELLHEMAKQRVY